jgi:hypothetical protein
MQVAVLGGGLQGCCVALALAERGANVVLFDRNEALLSRTAVANEGKVHLGYMYASDPTFSTARTMMQGALAFQPFLQRYLGTSSRALQTSAPSAYVVHRNSRHSSDTVRAYLTEVHRLVGDAARGRERAYFGRDLSAPLRAWSSNERDALFDQDAVLAVFDTAEVAINPNELASALRACIAVHPRIETRLSHHVFSAERNGDTVKVTSEGEDGRLVEAFDHVVNALWDGRLAVDETMGLRPKRPWLHRLKYGVSFTLPPGVEQPPSVTIVSGPFGEVVSYPDRLTYFTWYPECLQSISAEVTPPPQWATYPQEPLRSQVLNGTIAAISNMMPCLAAVKQANLPDACVKGGAIIAWGKTDIYDPESELHRRYEIGITSAGRYHTIDPGKLTMAPWFAESCAARIIGSA